MPSQYVLESAVKKLPLLATICLLFFVALSAQAQQFDLAFGGGGLLAPSASAASSTHLPQTQAGGTYLAVSGDVLIKNHFGVSGEMAWRASQNVYGGFQPYRPLLWDFNAIYAPRKGRIGGDLMAGIGAETIRFYQPFFSCGFTGCTNYVSSNHFLGHFGAGLRLYPVGNFFIRPEAHVYLIHNNFEFSSNYATRVGVSIGYTFGPRF